MTMPRSPVPSPAPRSGWLASRLSSVSERGATTGLVLAITGLIAWEGFLRGATPAPPARTLSAPSIPAPDDAVFPVTAVPVPEQAAPAQAAPEDVVPALPDAAPVAPSAPAPIDPVATAPQPATVAETIAAAPESPALPTLPPVTAPGPVSVAPAAGSVQSVPSPVIGTVAPPSIAVTAPLASSGNDPARLAAMERTVAMGGLLPANRILAYYGHPHDPNMGILGEYEKEELLALLRAEAASYEAADPARPVIPAFEVIATVAQDWPTSTGHYLLDTDRTTLEAYADFAEANGILLFLDLQIGRNTVPGEIAKVMPLLERPHVHLALDPEFAIAEGQTPGTHIGELTAAQITEAQEILGRLVTERNLPPKILIVHQFQEDMILGKQELQPVDGVQVVIESDGFGPPASKQKVYTFIITEDEYEYSGVKHFYKQDVPVMTAAETLALDPSPLLVIYQ
jgi:hypothetical protein